MVSNFALARRCLGKVFRLARKILNYDLSTDCFLTTGDLMMFLHIGFILFYMFSYFILFLTSRCSKLDRFIIYLVHSLSTWFTHSFTFPFLQVKYYCCFYHFCLSRHMVEIVSFVPQYRWLFYISYPLGRLVLMILLILILYNLFWFYYGII